MYNDLKKLNILIVDDIHDHADILSRSIQHLGSEITIATRPEEAISILDSWDNVYDTIDVVIIDYFMPEMSGIELGKEIKKKDPYINIIIITADSSTETAREILTSDLQITAFIKKSENLKILVSALNYIITNKTERLNSYTSYVKERAAIYFSEKKNNTLDY